VATVERIYFYQTKTVRFFRMAWQIAVKPTVFNPEKCGLRPKNEYIWGEFFVKQGWIPVSALK